VVKLQGVFSVVPCDAFENLNVYFHHKHEHPQLFWMNFLDYEFLRQILNGHHPPQPLMFLIIQAKSICLFPFLVLSHYHHAQ